MTGITHSIVTVTSLVPERGVASCKDSATGHDLEVRLTPLRVRMPVVGDQWVVDKSFGGWSFMALISSPEPLSPTYVGATPPEAPRVGQRWVPTPAKVWDGTDWVDE